MKCSVLPSTPRLIHVYPIRSIRPVIFVKQKIDQSNISKLNCIQERRVFLIAALVEIDSVLNQKIQHVFAFLQVSDLLFIFDYFVTLIELIARRHVASAGMSCQFHLLKLAGSIGELIQSLIIRFLQNVMKSLLTTVPFIVINRHLIINQNCFIQNLIRHISTVFSSRHICVIFWRRFSSPMVDI